MKRNKMKLKNNIFIGSILSFIILSVSPTFANEEGVTYYCQGMVCTTTPPAPTSVAAFAIVDPINNEVKNVIVGNVEYYGNNDKTVGKEHPGCSSECKVVLQVPSDPVSGNVAGYKSSESMEVTHDSVENSFTVKQDGVIVQKFISPEITKTSNSTTITSLGVSFSDTSTVNSILEQNQNNTQSATISASSITTTGNYISLVSENLVIEKKVTQEQAVTIINNSGNSIMHSKINRLMKLLGDWLL
jgi:hypothetical protein